MSRDKVAQLARMEGKELMEMLEGATFDGSSPGICMNEGCDYTAEVEPDQDSGFCERCNTNTVKSCLVLAGII